MIKGFRFENQLANAEVDARIHQSFLNGNDGIFYGMNLSYTNTSITVSEGLCEVCGRPIGIIDSETIALPTESLFCVLALEIDLSKDSTKESFEQVQLKILSSSSDYPSLTKQDLNIYGADEGIYQFELARFKTGSTGITNYQDTRTFLDFEGIYEKVISDCNAIIAELQNDYEAKIEELEEELASVEDGSAYLLKTGGSASGNFTFSGNITANNISNSNRK